MIAKALRNSQHAQNFSQLAALRYDPDLDHTQPYNSKLQRSEGGEKERAIARNIISTKSNSHKKILCNITHTQPQGGANYKHGNTRNRAPHIWAWALQIGLNCVLPEYAEWYTPSRFACSCAPGVCGLTMESSVMLMVVKLSQL